MPPDPRIPAIAKHLFLQMFPRLYLYGFHFQAVRVRLSPITSVVRQKRNSWILYKEDEYVTSIACIQMKIFPLGSGMPLDARPKGPTGRPVLDTRLAACRPPVTSERGDGVDKVVSLTKANVLRY